MNLQEFLSETETYIGQYHQDVRPRVICKDGFSMSVQGSSAHYCLPREDGSVFTHLEIGYPSDMVEEFMPYAENEQIPMSTVYGGVPFEIIESVIEKHGGIANKLNEKPRHLRG